MKETKGLVLLADPGPVFEGYVEWKFQDEATSDKEADVCIAELKRDFAKYESKLKRLLEDTERIKL